MKVSIQGVLVISFFVLLAGCSNVTSFSPSEVFKQEDHIDGDIPDPSSSPTPSPSVSPSAAPSALPSSSPSPSPSVSPTPTASPSPRPSSSPTPSPTMGNNGNNGHDCDYDGNDDDDDGHHHCNNNGHHHNPGVPESFRCGQNREKVSICHIPPGNASNPQTLCVSVNGAVNGHGVPLDGSVGPVSGDYLGQCRSGGVSPHSHSGH